MSIESIINYSDEEKVQQFLMLIKDPAVQPAFRAIVESVVQSMMPTAIENFLVTSEYKILKRLQAVEKQTGLYEFDESEEHETTIAEKLNEISDKIDSKAPDNLPENLIEPIEPDLKVKPKSSLESKAFKLVEFLKEQKPRGLGRGAGEIYLTSAEAINFLKNDIDEEYSIKDDSNPNRAKIRVFERAKKLFSDTVFIVSTKKGTKELRLVYRPIGR